MVEIIRRFLSSPAATVTVTTGTRPVVSTPRRLAHRNTNPPRGYGAQHARAQPRRRGHARGRAPAPPGPPLLLFLALLRAGALLRDGGGGDDDDDDDDDDDEGKEEKEEEKEERLQPPGTTCRAGRIGVAPSPCRAPKRQAASGRSCAARGAAAAGGGGGGGGNAVVIVVVVVVVLVAGQEVAGTGGGRSGAAWRGESSRLLVGLSRSGIGPWQQPW
ncbi:hypothetical protein VTK26DRAFT_4170 [Humicola hyalothermophila]